MNNKSDELVGRLFALLLLCALPAAAQAQEFQYATNNGAVTITQYTGAGGDVIIPGTITGLPVASIGIAAFGRTDLTSVTIPDSVTSIGLLAFSDCYSLTGVTIPNSLISIGASAFAYCISLTNVTIPDRVTSIGSGAFSSCRSLNGITVDALNSVYCSVDGVVFNKSQTTLIQYPAGRGGIYAIPNSVTAISDAFSGCITLTSVTIPDSVTSIGGRAFSGCLNLTSVTIPNNLISIGASAFSGCGISSVTIPESVTSIGDYAFLACSRLSAVTVDALNSVYSSVDGVLFNKSQTTLIQYPASKGGSSYTIPDSVTSIGDYSFYNSSSLTSVTIPHSVTSIGDFAFSYCYNLTDVTIPDSVTSIGQSAFSGCTRLTGIYFRGNAPSLGGESVFHEANQAIVYYLPGTTGWGATLGGRPTAVWSRMEATEARFVMQTNAFGFTWPSGQIVVVEACANLTSPVWSRLQTNTLDSGPLEFSDPDWTNHPARFYRLRAP